jgi:hypothetical protein
MNKYNPTAFKPIDYLQHAHSILPRKDSPTATFEALLPETQGQYYQPQRKEKEDAKQEQLNIIRNRETIQAAIRDRDASDKEIALITTRQAERKRTKGLGLKKSTTVGDLTKTKYNMRYESEPEDPNETRRNNKYEEAQMRYESDPDPNETWRDSYSKGGRGTNLHSLGRGTNLHSLGRGTNLHSLGRRRTRTTKRRRTKQKKIKTKRRRTKSTRKKRKRPRRSPSKARLLSRPAAPLARSTTRRR